MLSDLSTIKIKLKELFRLSHIPAKCDNDDVMSRFFKIRSNGYKPVLIERIMIDMIQNKYGGNGYVKISANRSGFDNEVDYKHTRDLIIKIKRSGYAYLPIYDSYGHIDNVEEVHLPSFFVFNYKTNEESLDFSLLESLALQWCKEHNQNNVFIVSPGKEPKCIDKEGNKVNNNELTNDCANKCYVNPMPCTLNERLRRKGEVMIWSIYGLYKQYSNETVINGSKVYVEDGEVKTILSEEIQKSGYMTVDEADKILDAYIDKLEMTYGGKV